MVLDCQCHAHPKRSQVVVVMMQALTEAVCQLQAHAALTACTVHTKLLLQPQFA